MRLAENIVFKIGNSPVYLRPSLRAATILESRYGFQKIFAACADGNMSVITDVIEVSSNSLDFLKSLAGIPLIEVMPPILESLPTHILALAGIDPDNKAEPQGGESIPFAEYHARLFRIATGGLGWSPDVTWNATAAEIMEAYSGHLEMLRAIHGSGEETTRTIDRPEDAAFDRAGLMGLKAMGGAS